MQLECERISAKEMDGDLSEGQRNQLSRCACMAAFLVFFQQLQPPCYSCCTHRSFSQLYCDCEDVCNKSHLWCVFGSIDCRNETQMAKVREEMEALEVEMDEVKRTQARQRGEEPPPSSRRRSNARGDDDSDEDEKKESEPPINEENTS